MARKKSARYSLNYYDETGKRRGKTFTAPTRAMARYLADEWADAHLRQGRPVLVLSEALQRYVQVKAAALSPSTVRSYEGMRKNNFDRLNKMDIHDITNQDVQLWISDLVLSGLSSKTIKNCYGLLTAAIALQDDSIHFKVQLPQAKPQETYCPSDEDIRILIEQIQRDGDQELLRSVLLAAFGPCRRSEVCGIQSSDIEGNVVYIRRAVVKDENGAWVTKLPKTKDSYRKIVYPSFVTDLCEGIDGPIIKHTPDYIGDKFRDTLKRSGLPYFRYHDLRHYGASIMMYMGVSQKTIEMRGGWSSNSPVLKRIYQNKIEEELKKENNKILEHFEKFAVNI